MNILSLSSFLTAIISGFLATAIFIYGKNKLQRMGVLFNSSVALWGLGCFIVGISNSPEMSLLGWRIALGGGVFISTTFYHTIIVLGGITKRKVLRLAYILDFLFIVLIIRWNEYLLHRDFYTVGNIYYPNGTVFYVISIVFWVFIVFLGFIELYKILKSSIGAKRTQIYYLFIGALIGFAGGTSLHLPFVRISFYPIGNLGVTVYSIVVTYAILRHHLLDIRIAGARAGIFTLVYSIVLGIPFGLAVWGKLWLKAYLGEEWFWAPMLLLLTLSTAGPFIYNVLRKKAEAAILKEELRCRALIGELAKNIAYMRHIHDLLDKVTSGLAEGVRMKFAAFWMMEDFYKSYQLKSCFPKEMTANLNELIKEDDPLVTMLSGGSRVLTKADIKVLDLKFDAELVIPCMVKERLMGILVLGAKENNMEYGLNDLITYGAFGTTLSLTIENCIFWHEIETRQRRERVKEMDIFSYSMRHEVGNPTIVAKGHAEMLRDTFLEMIPEGTPRKDFEAMTGFIIETTGRVLKMLDAIKNFGAAATGIGEPVSLEKVIEQLCLFYEPQLLNNKIAFEKILQENKDNIRVNGEMPVLMTALENLLKNAEHAVRGVTDKKITIRTEYVGEHARVIVADNGYGIKPEFMPVLFAPFTTTKASTEGTGMGLFDVRRMVQQYNGRVWGESPGLGKGATFYIELPIRRDKPEEEDKPKKVSKRIF